MKYSITVTAQDAGGHTASFHTDLNDPWNAHDTRFNPKNFVPARIFDVEIHHDKGGIRFMAALSEVIYLVRDANGEARGPFNTPNEAGLYGEHFLSRPWSIETISPVTQEARCKIEDLLREDEEQ